VDFRRADFAKSERRNCSEKQMLSCTLSEMPKTAEKGAKMPLFCSRNSKHPFVVSCSL
jgi:hypothetical protein